MTIEEKDKIDITYHLFACNEEGELATGTFGAATPKYAVEEVMRLIVPTLIEALEEYPSRMISLIIDATKAVYAGGLLIYPYETKLPVEIKCGRCGIELGTINMYNAKLKCPECELTHVVFEEVNE